MKGFKINIFIFSFLIIFSFLACSHITDSDSEEDFQTLTQNSDRTFNISGTITTQDEYSSRTAFPSVPKFAENDAEKFIVKATLKSDENITILGSVKITGTSAEFSIQLPKGDWKIAVNFYETEAHSNLVMKGFYKDNSGNDYLSITDVNTTLSKIYILMTYADSEDVPNGKGKAKFEITVPTNITKISLECATCSSTSSCPLNISNYTSGSEITDISAGSHFVTFKLYDVNDTLLYSFTELIHIFAYSLTDIWKTKAEYISSDGKSINITDEILKNYSKKIFFIANSNGNDTTGTGSFFKPYKTIQKAVDTIETINDETTEYQIKLLDDISATGTGNAVDINPAKTLKLIISSVDSNKKIDANKTCRVMNIGEKALVTLENVTITNGSELAGGGIYVSGTLNVNDGTKITNNTASNCGAGIYVCNGTLNFSGNSEISGNLAKGTESLNGGGGIYLKESTLTSETAASVLLKNNQAYKNGGGIFISQKSTANINHFEIAENKANYDKANYNSMGGGIYVVADASNSSANASTLSIENSLVYGNETIYGYGGGIFIDKNCIFNLNRGTIVGNSSKPNKARPNPIVIAGNGIYAKECSMTFDGDITIFENEAIALNGTQITLSDRFEQPTYTILLQPETYTVGTQILTGAGLTKYTSFKVENENWEIRSDGKLQEIEIAKKFIQRTNFSGLKTVSDYGTLPSGTKTILISTLGDLQTLAEWNKTVAIENHEFLLTTNISVPSDWYGLGVDQTFITTFDGNGYTITFNNTNCGLVKILSRNGCIKNLTIDGSISFNQNIGGIVSTVKGSSTIENCVNKAAINNLSASQSFYTGGIVGKKQSGSCKIINCINEGTITAPDCKYVGGIVGGTDSDNDTKVENCANIGSIGSATSTYVGGIIGGTTDTDYVKNCYNNGVINGTGNYVASIVGYHNSSMTIEHCYFNSSKCSKVYENSTSDPDITAFTSSSTLETDLNSWIKINDSYHITYYNWETKTGSSPTLKYSR